jgi:HK97 family phage major capsid protein
MSTAVLDKIRTERDQVRAAALAIAEGDNFDPADENFKELEARAAALDTRAASLAKILEEQAAADALDGRLAKAQKRQDDRQEPGRAQVRESWGEMFVRSEGFKEYRGRGQSAVIELESDPQVRALPTGLTDLVSAGLTFGKTSVDLTAPQAPTPLLDNITTVNVTSNAVEYVAWAKTAGGAAVVAEKGNKPSAEWAPTVTSDTLDTIAVYTQLTRQLIEDAPAVRSLIDGELRRDVIREEEAQAAAALAAATVPTATSTTLLGAIRVGIAEVQEAGYFPGAVLLNPADYAELDIDVMGATLNGPQISQRFWGLTPIPSAGQAAGTATVGDFRAAIQRFVRSQVNLYVTDSHASTFLSNVFTLLAERRSLTAVVRPQALVEVSVAP